MSDAHDPDTPDSPDLIAAEYVLGVLDASERRAAELRLAADPAFARQADAWAKRLNPLAQAIASVAPPIALWDRIERVVNGDRGRDPGKIVDLGFRRSLAIWRTATSP